jgi:hypothetical protein
VHRFPIILDPRLFAIKLVFREAGNEIKSGEKMASLSEISAINKTFHSSISTVIRIGHVSAA